MDISNDYVKSTLALLGNTTQKAQDTSNDTNANGVDSFANMLKSQLDNVNNLEVKADNDTQTLVKGGDIDIHQVMLSTEEAKLSLETAVQVRNKLVEAYQEINRMQL